jgi:hypothetical protein
VLHQRSPWFFDWPIKLSLSCNNWAYKCNVLGTGKENNGGMFDYNKEFRCRSPSLKGMLSSMNVVLIKCVNEKIKSNNE